MHTLLHAEAFDKLIDYAWCVVDHCPSASACMFPTWGEDECKSEVHNFLGFAYRSAASSTPQEYRQQGYAHYHASLTLNSENCGTWGYLGQMMALDKDQVEATRSMDALCTLHAADKCDEEEVALLRKYVMEAGLSASCDTDANVAALVAGLPPPEVDIEVPDHSAGAESTVEPTLADPTLGSYAETLPTAGLTAPLEKSNFMAVTLGVTIPVLALIVGLVYCCCCRAGPEEYKESPKSTKTAFGANQAKDLEAGGKKSDVEVAVPDRHWSVQQGRQAGVRPEPQKSDEKRKPRSRELEEPEPEGSTRSGSTRSSREHSKRSSSSDERRSSRSSQKRDPRVAAMEQQARPGMKR
jgi:hypothetical protein